MGKASVPLYSSSESNYNHDLLDLFKIAQSEKHLHVEILAKDLKASNLMAKTKAVSLASLLAKQFGWCPGLELNRYGVADKLISLFFVR
jgi:hypothetical protein